MRFTHHMRRLIRDRKRGEAPNTIFEVNTKRAGRELAKSLDVPVPRDLTTWFNAPHGPAMSCVIKPNQGCTSRAVLPLEYEGGGLYRSPWVVKDAPEIVAGSEHWPYWLGAFGSLMQRHRNDGVAGPPLVEAMIHTGREPSFAWKFYCIGGRPIWCRQVDQRGRLHGRVRCWQLPKRADPRQVWTPFPFDVLVGHSRQILSALPHPRHPVELMEAAERIAWWGFEHHLSPFLRVDMLEDEEGVYFCEITPHPSGGNDRYRDDIDLELGELWERTTAVHG